MHPARRAAAVLLASSIALAAGAASAADLRLELREGWAIQSSAQVAAGGEAVARPGFATSGWHRATVPTTVVAALVADGTYPDPYYGMNLRAFPGDVLQGRHELLEPADARGQPFRRALVVPHGVLPARAGGRSEVVAPHGRRELPLRRLAQRHADRLCSENGRRLPRPRDRRHGSGAGRCQRPRRARVRPDAGDLAITFVDWNPMPPDKLMGLYRPVTLTASGPVTLRHPQVVTTLHSRHRAGRADREGVRDERERRRRHGHAPGSRRGCRLPEERHPRTGRVARDRPRSVRLPAARAREAEALVAGPVRRAGAARSRARVRRGPSSPTGRRRNSASASSRRSSSRAAASTR